MTSYSTLIETMHLSCTVFELLSLISQKLTRNSAIAEGPREALVSRNPATTKHLNPIVVHYLRDSTFSRFDTIPECDRHTHTQTDGQTHNDGIYRT